MTPGESVDQHGAGAGVPDTLVVDLGGTHVRAAVVDAAGRLRGQPDITKTPYPLEPGDLVRMVGALAERLTRHERTTIGFPGFVRDGTVLTAPHFTTTAGPGTPIRPDLVESWTGFGLAAAIGEAVDRPVLVANDADLHGAAVVIGTGIELVVTLGTGVGVSLFADGWLCPHLELAHHPLVDGETYNEHLGDRARRRVGDTEWQARVARALDALVVLLRPDLVWLGGGNGALGGAALGSSGRLVDPLAALSGGARLWNLRDAGPGRFRA